MLKYITLLLFLVAVAPLFGQNYNQYEPIKSSGKVPSDFTRLSSEKFESDRGAIDKDDSRQSRKVKEEFYLESNFGIDEILSNGRILFNDPLSNYLNEIYANIEAANPELKESTVKFYTSRSTIVNAFTTHGGIIFFNVALLAKLQTEDEIAFVMCHELAHFIHKHNIKQYSYNDEIDRDRGVFKDENWESKMFAKANYSQTHETEADKIGFDLFKNTNYAKKSALAAIKSLKSYNIPFESKQPFSANLLALDSKQFQIPNIIHLDSIEVKTYSNSNKLSTHPDIDTRLSAIETYFTETSATAKPNKVLTMAQFEMCHLYLEKAQYSQAIYSALALQKTHASSQYLKEILLKAIYGIAQTKTYLAEYNSKDANDYLYSETMPYQAAPIQQINAFFDSIEASEANAIAIVSLWKYVKTVKNKNGAMTDRLIDLIEAYKSFYETETPHQAVKDLLAGDNDFKRLHQKANSFTLVKNNKNSNEVAFEGIDDMLILSPEYRKFNLKNDKSYKYKASESLLKTYHGIIDDNTQKLKIKKEVLSNSFIKDTEVDMFNDIALINSFLIENSACTPNVLSSKREAILKLTDKYGTNKMSLMGLYSFQFAKEMGEKVGVLLWTGIVFPTLPLGIWYAFKPNFITYNYTLVYDLSTEKMVYANLHPIKMRGSKSVVTSTMYSDLLTIAKGKK